jgi:glucokinase
MIIAGDLGGTKSNLGAFEFQHGKLRLLTKKRFLSHGYPRAEDVIRAFVGELDCKITAACFDVAGPVVDNVVQATNLPWIVDGKSLARLLGIGHVPLLNDLEATGYGLQALEPQDFETLHKGMPARANRAVIAAGTGLGETILFWDGEQHVPRATEGGHADFAPHTDVEIDLLRHLMKKYGTVDCETVLSGRGFLEIHEFLDPKAQHPSFSDPGLDAAPEITRRGLERSCPVCVRTLDLWVRIYGSEAGNFALRSLARGGMYVAGGIAVKILPKLKDGRFNAALADKGKFRGFLSQIPVYVVLNEDAPLLGSAHVASRAAQ